MGQRKVVSFSGTALAMASVVLVSRPMMRPFMTRRMHVTFPPGCNNLVNVSIWISADAEAPAAGGPSGVNLLQDYGQVDYLEGDDERMTLQHEVVEKRGGSYLKVYVVNGDVFDHTINAQVEIELLEEGRA